MCLLMQQRRGYTLPVHQLDAIYKKNPDGFGLMYHENGELYTMRLVGTRDDVNAAYHKYAAGRACLLHWRMRTHGKANVDNAHPFLLTGTQIAIMHNGMIDCGTPDMSMSDTYHMATHMLAPIARDNPDALFTDEFEEFFGDLITSANRVAMLRNDGRVSIINKHTGVTYMGNWFSNTYAWDCPTSLIPPKRTYSYTNGRYTQTNAQLWGEDEGFESEIDEDTYGRQTLADVIEANRRQRASDFIGADVEDVDTLSGKDRMVALAELAHEVNKDHEAGAARWLQWYPLLGKELVDEWYAIDTDMTASTEVACMLVELLECGAFEDELMSWEKSVSRNDSQKSTTTALTLVGSAAKDAW